MTQPNYPPTQPPYWPPNQNYPGQQQQPQQPQQLPQPQVLGPNGQPWPQQPGAPQPGAPYPQPGMYPQQQQAPYPQAPPPPPPPSFQVNEQAIQEAYQQSQQSSGGFDGPMPTYFRWLGPQRETTWKAVYVGFERVNEVWICQPSTGQSEISFTLSRHHIVYYEGGQEKHDNIDCWDPATCGICLSSAIAAQDPQLANSVKRAEARPQNYYQLLDLANPQIHYLDGKGVMRQDQLMRPLILACTKTLHNKIGACVSTLGMVTKLVDPYSGRPLLISRKKTGPENRDVEYGAQYAPDQQALPEVFWPALQNLWDLREIRKKPTQEDWTQACVRLGWPVVGAPTQAQVPANWQQGPMPPHQNPYGPPQGMPPAPPAPAMPSQGMAPPHMPPQMPPQMPPVGPGPQMPPQQPPGMPPQMPPQQPPGMPPQMPPQIPGMPQMPPQQPPGMPPQMPQAPLAPQSPGIPQGPPPPAGGPPPQAPVGPPPPMNAPPISTAGGAPDAGAYAPTGQPAPQQPQSGMSFDYGPPPLTGGETPFNQPPTGTPVPQLALDSATGCLPGGVTLHQGRERCFGKHNVDHAMCKECPHEIKTQCLPATGGSGGPSEDGGLEQLQLHLGGGS